MVTCGVGKVVPMHSVSKPATAGRVMGVLCCCVMCDSREHWESSVWSHVNSHIGDFKFIPLSLTPQRLFLNSQNTNHQAKDVRPLLDDFQLNLLWVARGELGLRMAMEHVCMF